LEWSYFSHYQMVVRQKLKDLFLNEWYSRINESSNTSFYKFFKKSLGIEPYLSYSQCNDF
jgi:hypothetical protein